MHKNEVAEGAKLPQKIGTTVDYSKDSKLLKLSFDSSGDKATYLTSEQNYLFDLWTTFEQIQDAIHDQSSPEYNFFEIINPILFDTWVSTRRLC